MNKKGFQVKDMLTLGITIVVLGIGLGLGSQVLGDVQDEQTSGSAEFNATGDAIEGLGNFSSKLPLIALVIVTAVIIGIIVKFLVVRNK